MAAPIGALLVELKANTTAFAADMRNMRRELQTSTQQMTKSLGNVEAGVGLLTKGLGAVGVALSAINLTQFTMQSLKAAAELGDMADRLGVNVEKLQEYRFAATQAGASIEDMDKALTKFAVVLGDAQRGEEQAQSKLARLGIHWRDTAGRVRDVDSAWRDFANTVASEKDNAEALAILADTLGERFGPKLLVSLQQGAAGFDEAGQKAREWGAIMSAEAIAKAREFDDTLDALAITAKAWAVEGATAAPGLAKSMFQPYIDGAQHLLNRWNELVAHPLARLLLPGRAPPKNPTPPIQLPPGIEAPIAGDPRDTAALGRIGARGDDIARPPPVDPKVLREQAKAMSDAEEMAAKDSAEAWEAFNQSIIRQEQERQARHKAMLDAIAAQEEMAAEDAQGAWDAFNEQQAKLGREIQQIWDDTRTPLERFNEQMDRLNQLLQQGSLDWDTYQRAVAKAKEELEQAEDKADKTGSAARELGLTFQSAFEDAVVGGNDFREVLQGIAKDLTRIFIRKQITEPLIEAFDVMMKGKSALGGGGGGLLGGLGNWLVSLFGGGSSTAGASGFVTDFSNSAGFSSLQMGFASGTDHAPPGMAWVGEEGPELMTFRGGEKVFPHDESMAMARGGPTVFIDARGADRQGLEMVKRQIAEINGTFNERAVSAVALAQAGGRLRR
jgi:ribosomal protein S11